MGKIYYVAQYACESIAKENRQYSLAGAKKVETILEALIKLEHEVEIVAYGRTKTQGKIFRGSRTFLSKSVFIKTFFSWGLPYPWYKFDGAFQLIQMLFYLLLVIKKDDTLLVYHSLLTLFPIKIFKKIRSNRLILEVEEFYQDVSPCSNAKKKEELRSIMLADAYLFSTEHLNQKLNASNKKYLVISGTYKIEKDRRETFSDGKIHCIYAGTLEPTKGSLTAVSVAEFLPSNYHMHILGFGSKRQIEQLQSVIKQIQETSECSISYDGVLKGEEYIRFIQKCNIGLCTQTPDVPYAASSFPSKIFVYLANGLKVLSVRIPVIEQSDVGDLINYYDDPQPSKIAIAIRRIELGKEENIRERLEKLNCKFLEELNAVIS